MPAARQSFLLRKEGSEQLEVLPHISWTPRIANTKTKRQLMTQAAIRLGIEEIKLPRVSLRAGVLANRRGLSIFRPLAAAVNYLILC